VQNLFQKPRAQRGNPRREKVELVR
jgi:hypothetical protein